MDMELEIKGYFFYFIWKNFTWVPFDFPKNGYFLFGCWEKKNVIREEYEHGFYCFSYLFFLWIGFFGKWGFFLCWIDGEIGVKMKE